MQSNSDEIWVQLLLSLSQKIDSKISASGRHSSQVADWVQTTARRFMPFEQDVSITYWASLFHDIGKVGVSQDILVKKGPLSNAEWVVMRLHPTVGANIIRSLASISQFAPIVNCHQEKFDGSGYPFGLKGECIPLGARILAVVDAYDAMTNDRVYRKACSHDDAATELVSLKGRHFDPYVVDHFLEMIGTSESAYIK